MPDDVFRWFVALGVLLAMIATVVQAVLFFVIYRISSKAVDKGLKIADRVEPMIDKANEIVAANAPKVTEIMSRAVEISHSATNAMATISDRVTRAIDAAERAVQKADEGIDAVVHKTEEAAGAVKDQVAKPVRNVRGVLAGVRAGLSSLRHGAPTHEGNGNGRRAA
jgi:hypothetical protein